jgi:hypothetical protein
MGWLGMLAACNSGPFNVLASCDLTSSPTTSVCMELSDEGFLPKAQSICEGSDGSTSYRWHPGKACDRTGSLGGCRKSGLREWIYPSSTIKTEADVRAKCANDGEKFVALTEDLPPGAAPSASQAPAATPQAPTTPPAVTPSPHPAAPHPIAKPQAKKH